MRIGLAVAAVIALALGFAAATTASTQGTVTVAIDVNVNGNGGRTVGSIENCARIDSGSQLEIDVVLPDPGVSADDGIKAWQFNLIYDPSILNVAAEDKNMLLTAASGSLLFPVTNPPDSDGDYLSSAFDNSEEFHVEPDGAQETGPGVITRITLSALSKGSTNLTLKNVVLVKVDNTPIPLGSVLGAAVAVDTSCTPPPSPTPLAANSSPVPGQTPGAVQTPDATGSPSAQGTPGAGPDGQPDNEQTTGASTPGPGTPTGPGTPVLGGTPVSDGEAQQSDDDGGLSAGAWAGIGVAIAAAVLAGAGGGWYIIQRRKSGSE